MADANSFFKKMDKKQIEELLAKIEIILECLDNEREKEAYQKIALSADSIRDFLLFLLKNDVLERDIVIGLMADILNAMEQKDDVLMIDTLKYGVQTLILDILKIMEESDE